MKVERASLISAIVYTSLSLLAVGVFLAAATLKGDYNLAARLGGAAWVFLLSMIILMPTVTPWVKGRMK